VRFASEQREVDVKPTFKEKVLAFIFVALGTAGGIFVSTHLVVGVLGVCK
jgi:hypothetical protein